MDQKSTHTFHTKSDSSSSLDHIQLKAVQPIGMYSTNQILQLQKSIGNSAVTQLVDPPVSSSSKLVLQRRIMIDEKIYTYKKLEELLPSLIGEQGYRTWGIKIQIRIFIREKNGEKFADMNELLRAFKFWLRKRHRNLDKFKILKMPRPAWSEGIKKKLGYMKKDNIRHVIRNATLKRALEVEYNREPQREWSRRIIEIAKHIGLPTDASIDRIAQSVYKKVYLNLANLFAGRGDYNQLIGFAADPVKEYGEELLRNGDTPISRSDVVEKLKGIIQTASSKARLETRIQFCMDVDELFSVFEEDTPSEGIGELVINMGLNFGFDLVTVGFLRIEKI